MVMSARTTCTRTLTQRLDLRLSDMDGVSAHGPAGAMDPRLIETTSRAWGTTLGWVRQRNYRVDLNSRPHNSTKGHEDS